MFYSADKHFKKENMSSYVAVAFDTDQKDQDLYYIKAARERTRKRFPFIDYRDTPYEFIPILSADPEQRDVLVCFGASGSGKSYFANKIAIIYKDMNPKRKIYFITNNNFQRDTALTHSLYEFINLNDLLDEYNQPGALEEFKINDAFDNSLIVFDDIDLQEDKGKKELFFTFLGVILKFKRKNQVSVIYTTHHVSDYKYTRELLIEQTCYIIFSGDLKNRSNRVLTDYLKLSSDEVSKIVNNDSSRWTCIKTRYRTVITQKEIYGLI